MSNALSNLATKLPKLEIKIVLASAALLFLGVALHEHDQWIRERAALTNVQKQANAQAAELSARAQSAERAAATQSSRADSLAATRAAIEQRNRELSQQLAALTTDERLATEQVATLPARDVVARVAARLGKEQVSGAGVRVSGVNTQKQDVSGTGASHLTPDTSSQTSQPVLGLTDSGARKVETAFVELDACASERANLTRQLAGCNAGTTADAQALAAEKSAADQLKLALAAKDQELVARDRADKAQLKAVRGTFFSRLTRTAEHIAIGVGVGVVMGGLIH
jgi:hypothetical protein